MRSKVRAAIHVEGSGRRAGRDRRQQLEMQAFVWRRFCDAILWGERLKPGSQAHAIFHAFYDAVDAERAAQGLPPATRMRQIGGDRWIEARPS